MSITQNLSRPRSAESLAQALSGKKSGDGWIACCPAHEDNDPSLSISENPKGGNPLVHCFAGCSQEEVIEALKADGLWASRSKSTHTNQRTTKVDPETQAPDPEHQARTVETPRKETKEEFAQEIWDASLPAADTTVSIYLASRGITIPPPDSLRFYPDLKHDPSQTRFPCMVAQITGSIDGSPLGIHRTFLAPDGKGKAPVDQVKMMLGPSKGGVVRLGEPTDVLMIGEGIETCLSVMQVTGHPAWAALSAGGLRDLELTPGDYKVIILADADDAGEKAASDAARRWVEDERRKVFIAWPPPHNDFNDILRDPLSECSLIERIKFEESKAITLSTKDMFRPEITGDHSVFDFINMVKETYNHVGDDETNLITNDPPHPILEIIKNAKEIRDPLDEIVDKLEAGSLTPDELLSDGVMELVALRREKEGGTTFCENLRKEVLAQKICRARAFDETLNKKLKQIKERREEKLHRHNQIADNYKKSENTTEKDYEWRKELQRAYSRTGFPYELNSAFNLKLYLCNDPDIKGTFRLNEKTCRVEVTKAIPASEIKWTETRSLTDEDIFAVQVWFSENRLQFGASLIAQQIKNVAAENAYNPLVDWLEALPQWDGTKRLHEVMPKGWSTVDNAYTREVGELLIKGIVARIMHPGCEFRLVPILIGRQWIGKSASLKALVGDRWVTDQFIKPGSKDTLQLLRDYVIAELGEMDVPQRAQAEELKQFISSRYDDIRDPYAREPKRHPRSWILVGTSNQSAKGLLNDPGENTRFLPLQILDKVDFDFIKANKDRWFAEAFAWAKTQNLGQTYFKLSEEALVIADELRDEYRTEEPLEEAIMEYALAHPEGFTNEDCAQYLVDHKKASHGHYLKIQIGTVMIKNKYEKKRAPKGHSSDKFNRRVRIYVPPEEGVRAKTEAALNQQKSTEEILKFCVNCKHSQATLHEKGQGRCNKKGMNIPLFTHLPDGCELYEEKKDNVVPLRAS